MNEYEAEQFRTLGRGRAIQGRKMRDMASEVIRLNEEELPAAHTKGFREGEESALEGSSIS